MNQTAIRQKLLTLQAQLEAVRTVVERRPDFSVDETNWKRVRTAAKQIRKTLYRERYGKRQRLP